MFSKTNTNNNKEFFEFEEIKDILVIKALLKNATFNHAETFKDFFTNAIKDRSRKIIIDLSNTEYIDSTFLGAIVICFKDKLCDQCRFKIVCVDKVKFIICEITKLSKVFDVYENIEDAIEDYKNHK